MHIAICFDGNFIIPSGVLMQSVCVNNSDEDITFHVVSDGLDSRQEQLLKGIVNPFKNKTICFYSVNSEEYQNLPGVGKVLKHITTGAAYYRLHLGEILPNNINKVLYLDGDTIVRGSLSELWDTDVENCALAAAPEPIDGNEETFALANFPMSKVYFNSGVMLLNLSYWRKQNILEKCKEFMQNHSDQIAYLDQDVLNYVCQDCKNTQDIKYNLQSGYLRKVRANFVGERKDNTDRAIENPTIVHYTGGGKPWTKGCRHPFRILFLYYYAQTPWRNTPLQENRPIGLRLKKNISKCLRKLKLMQEESPYASHYIPNLTILTK